MSKKICFIITPIGNENDPIRRHIDGVIDAIISPAMQDEFEIKVAHRLFQTGSINKQVIELIYKSELIIANLTGKNPNVMYELAFRHTLGLPTIIMAEKGTELPFDISEERTVFYTNDSRGTIEAKEELKRYLKQINFEKQEMYGPIHDVLDSDELLNIVFSHNRNINSTEMMNMIYQRLESIEKIIPNMQKYISAELVEEVMIKLIEQDPDINAAKLNMNITILNDKILKMFNLVKYYTEEIIRKLNALNKYIFNNTVNGKNRISERICFDVIAEIMDTIRKFQDDIQILCK